MSKLLIIIATVATVTSTLSARTVRSIFLQPPPGAPKSAFLYTGSEAIEVELPTRNLSAEVEIPKGQLSLAILPNALGEDGVVPSGAQRVNIPVEWENCLMVFLPAAQREVFPATVLVINTSDSKFPIGETMIYNLTKTHFMGQFGNSQLAVKPWKNGSVKPTGKNGKVYPVAIDCVFPETNKRTAITRTNWVDYPDARQILFVTMNSTSKVPRIWGVVDRVRKEDDE